MFPPNAQDLQRAAASAAAGDLEQAERLLRAVLARAPDDVQTWNMLGLVLARRLQFSAALACFDEVLRRHARSPEVWANRADAQHQLRRFADAVDSYDSALRLNPSQSDWWHLRGTALISLRRFDVALQSFDRALALDGARAQSVSARGVALEGLGRLREAADCYRKALEIAPGYATARANLGRLQREAGDLNGALASLRAAVAQNPDHVMAHHNLGCALYDAGDLEGCIASYRRALTLAPNFAECEYSLATALLKRRDFTAGWNAFEARLRLTRHDALAPPLGLAQWDGGPLGTRTLVLVAEAGAGDMFQFVRYAALLNAAGIRPVLQAGNRMSAILRSTGYFSEVFSPDTRFAPERHVWCSLMSLPFHLRPEAGEIPSFASYLQADDARIASWRARLESSVGMRIGIVWQGNLAAEIGSLRGRSLPLAELEPLARLPGVALISLQKGAGTEQLGTFALRERILDLGPELDTGADAFLDTAAVLKNLDLVVTVDTSMAHLAGALGVPVWLLLHRTADWRWFEELDSSPWYPSMRLFRQTRQHDWRPLVDTICSRLAGRPAWGTGLDPGRAESAAV